MTTKKARVGIIGVGRMGQPMVKHMIRHGFEVTAVDVSKDNLAKVAEMGAKIADTPAALGAVSDFIILGVGYDEEVNEVTLGANGVLAALPRGAIIAAGNIRRRIFSPRPPPGQMTNWTCAGSGPGQAAA